MAGIAQSAAATAKVDDSFLMISSDNIRALFCFLKELNFTSIVKAQVVARRQCDVTADGWRHTC
jgi:hypothetical protein